MFWDVVRDIACQKRRAKHIVWRQNGKTSMQLITLGK